MTASTAKATQVDYYDHQVEDPEFEINRPHGQARLYRMLMDFKFQKVLGLLDAPIRGSSVLVVCCGSGMDAEYAVLAGAEVVALDISAGCLNRARTRGARFGVTYSLVRADAENLPFRDGSFDYAFVHDGLHHLQEPARAIAEMARVARLGIMVTEPADAALTRFLVRIHFMKMYEEAGNYVIRFLPSDLELLCRRLGFHRFASTRYLVKYGHPPGRWWHLLDPGPVYQAAWTAFWVLGVALFGRWGNKLAFVALRN